MWKAFDVIFRIFSTLLGLALIVFAVSHAIPPTRRA